MHKSSELRANAIQRARTVAMLTLAFATFFSNAAKTEQSSQQGADQELAFAVELAPRGLWAEALFHLERALALDPSNYKVANNHAVAYEQAGQLELAETHYQKARNLAPNNTHIRRNYELFRKTNEKP